MRKRETFGKGAADLCGSFRVTRALPKDAETIGKIHAASWKAAYQDLFPPGYFIGFTPEKRAEIFRKNYGKGADETFLFAGGSDPLGMAILGPSLEEDYPEDIGEIGAFYFLPPAWGTGIAQQAMRYCLGNFQRRGMQGVILWVLEENRRARRFYEKCGFQFDGKQRDFSLENRVFSEYRYFQKL